MITNYELDVKTLSQKGQKTLRQKTLPLMRNQRLDQTSNCSVFN